MTITPPAKMVMTLAGVDEMFARRRRTPALFAEVRAELQTLRDWDNYQRTTDPDREAAKHALRRILDQER
jgi:hypothetical protein